MKAPAVSAILRNAAFKKLCFDPKVLAFHFTIVYYNNNKSILQTIVSKIIIKYLKNTCLMF